MPAGPPAPAPPAGSPRSPASPAAQRSPPAGPRGGAGPRRQSPGSLAPDRAEEGGCVCAAPGPFPNGAGRARRGRGPPCLHDPRAREKATGGWLGGLLATDNVVSALGWVLEHPAPAVGGGGGWTPPSAASSGPARRRSAGRGGHRAGPRGGNGGNARLHPREDERAQPALHAAAHRQRGRRAAQARVAGGCSRRATHLGCPCWAVAQPRRLEHARRAAVRARAGEPRAAAAGLRPLHRRRPDRSAGRRVLLPAPAPRAIASALAPAPIAPRPRGARAPGGGRGGAGAGGGGAAQGPVRLGNGAP